MKGRDPGPGEASLKLAEKRRRQFSLHSEFLQRQSRLGPTVSNLTTEGDIEITQVAHFRPPHSAQDIVSRIIGTEPYKPASGLAEATPGACAFNHQGTNVTEPF